jgi:dTDP-4-dehydrorhamnose 3,5-epimerase-like enzyme
MRSLDVVAAAGLPAVREVVPRRHQDVRGFFSEVWREDSIGGSSRKTTLSRMPRGRSEACIFRSAKRRK